MRRIAMMMLFPRKRGRRKKQKTLLLLGIHRGASTIAKRDDIWQGLLALRLLLALRHFCGSHVNLYMLHKTDLNIAGLKLTCLEYLDHQNVTKKLVPSNLLTPGSSSSPCAASSMQHCSGCSAVHIKLSYVV